MSHKTTVLYHSADFDGLFCREIARKFLPDAELIGWDYGNPKIPFPTEGQVYVLDLCPETFTESTFTPNALDRLIWIDHHASAIAKYPATIPGYRIDGVAACRLAWQWFLFCDGFKKAGNESVYPIQSELPYKLDFTDRRVVEPLAVRLAGEYDIWDKRDPDAELFQHGLRSCVIGQNLWDLLLVPTAESDGKTDIGQVAVSGLLEQGRAVQYAKTQENEGIIKSYGFDVDFEGLHFLACNHARFNSLLFTAGIKPEHDALLGFNWSGKDWRVSLYHAPGKEHHDLSQIAGKYGGGGHRGACGFRMVKLPWLP